MRRIKVIFFDEDTKDIIDHERFPNGEFQLNSSSDEGLIDILLEVNEVIIDDEVFRIIARRFSFDKEALCITLKRLT